MSCLRARPFAYFSTVSNREIEVETVGAYEALGRVTATEVLV